MSSATNNVQYRKQDILKWALTIALPLLTYFLIPIGGAVTPQLRMYLVTTLCGILVMAFELLPNFIIGVALPTSWVMLNVTTMQVAFSPWLQSSVLLIVGIYLMANVFEEIGLLNRVGYWCVWKCGGTFNGVIWGVFWASLVIAVITFANGTVIIAAFAYTICKALGLKPSKESAAIMVAAIMGGVSSRFFLYCPVSVSVLRDATRVIIPDFNLTWVELIGHNLPTLIFVFGFMFAYMKIMKTNDSPLSIGKEQFKAKYDELGPMTIQEKKAAVLFIIVMIYMLTQPWHGYDMNLGFIVLGVLFYLPGINLGSTDAIRKVPFDIAFLLVACLGIGAVGTSLGFTNVLTNILTPLLSHCPPKLALFGTLIMGGLANFILTPFAMQAALPAPIVSYCLALGWNPLPHIYALYLSTDIIFFPYEFIAYIIIYAFGMISMKHLVTVSAIKSLLFIVFFGVIMIPFWTFLGIV